MFRGGLGTTEILLILAVVVLLFGAKKLPDLARGSGRALRIFKAETKGLMDDDDDKPAVTARPDDERLRGDAARTDVARTDAAPTQIERTEVRSTSAPRVDETPEESMRRLRGEQTP